MKNLFLLLIAFTLGACSTTPTVENEESANTATLVSNVSPTPVAAKHTSERAEGKINWLSIQEAEKMTKKEPRKIIMDIYTHWCGPCKMLDRMTFSDPQVIKHINENYYAVKFNAESPDAITFNGKKYSNPQYVANKRGRNAPHQLTMALGIRGYPTMIVFGSDLKVKKQIVGFKQANQLMNELNGL